MPAWQQKRVDFSKLYSLVIKCYLSIFIDERCPINLFWVFENSQLLFSFLFLWLNYFLLNDIGCLLDMLFMQIMFFNTDNLNYTAYYIIII